MLKIEEGIIMDYFCFDVANEIYIDEIIRILGQKTEKININYERITPEYVQYKKAPIFIRLRQEEIGNKKFTVDIKIYDFGVITVRFWMPIKDSAQNISQFLRSISTLLRKKAISIVNKVLEEIKEYVHKPTIELEKLLSEYVIFFVQRFDKNIKPEDLAKHYSLDIVQLLRYEEKPLSSTEIKNILKNQLSYYSHDLTIIDFNSALIYDPHKAYDVPDVIEYALIELTELRAYDFLLDSVLENAYDQLSKKRLFGTTQILNKLSQIKLEISEIKEKVENFMKLINDSYLGKIYLAASERFYLEKWKSSVKEKLELLDSLYARNWENIQMVRLVWLDAIIVILFILDIIIILWELFGKFL